MKLILDVDTGIDDALAITYALSFKNIDLIGVTTSFGNVTLSSATDNTLRLLHLLDRDDIPVYPGAKCSIDANDYVVKEILHRVHGYNGMGDVPLADPIRKPEEISASQFMVESARKYGKNLTMVCVGPLTNLYRAIELDKDAILSVGNITIMGGALMVCGNMSPYAECNIYNDVLAAKAVFASGIHLNVIPLDVTWQTLIDGSDISSWIALENEKAKAICAITQCYYGNEFKSQRKGAMHDPLALHAAFNPSIITNWLGCNLLIEDLEASYGRMISSLALLNLKEKHMNVALMVDSEKFIQCFTEGVFQVISE